ncbi:MAG: Gfo/Idh/MocA family oxidoreductase [Crenarchaeota archaeon]|nr:Gfo/Idh/MocA family oxidoreductase [Thermoproteota archaeon]
MSNMVKVGISGLGRSGWDIHANALEKCSSMYKVVAVFDPIEERRKEAVNRFGCKAYSDFSSLIRDEDVELVVVATPSHLHAPQTIEALKSGKNVVCEKPMATSLVEADEMIKIAKETGRILTVFQNKRYTPDFLKVKEIVRSGKLGRIVLVKIYLHSFGRRWDWQTLKKFGGGELNNNASHLIDQAIQLVGEEVEVLFCDMKRTLTLGDAEDHVKIILGGPGSVKVDIEVTRACAYPQDYWLVMGTKGGLAGNGSSMRWKYFDPKDLPPRQVEMGPTPDRSYNWEEIPWKEEQWILEEDAKRSEILFYEELYKSLREGAPLRVTPESVRRVMQIIEECRKYYEEHHNKQL